MLRLLDVACDQIVNFKDVLDELCCQQDLLSLRDQGIIHKLLLHIVRALVQTINSKSAVVLRHLARLDLSQRLNWGQTRVLGQRKRDCLKSLGKGAHGILVNTGDLIGSLRNSERTGNLGSSATIDDTVIPDQVTDDANSIVKRALGLINDHLVASTNEHSDGTGVGALLNDQHAILGGSEAQLTNDSCMSELGSGKVFETRNNASVGSNSNQLKKNGA